MRRIGVGTQGKVRDLQNTGAREPSAYIAGKIEQGVAVARRRREEAFTRRILSDEASDQIGPDFVALLADHRSNGGEDLLRTCAKIFHCGDGCLHYAGKRASPAGMRRANHARHRIRKKDRAAISRCYANG